MKQLLERVVATGLFGKTVPEAVDRLVARSIEGLVKDGIIALPSRKRSDG